VRAWLSWLLVARLAANAMAASDLPPLPTWDEAERKQLERSGWLPGAALLTDETPATEPNPLDAEMPTAEELRAPLRPVAIITDKQLAVYFGARPSGYLIDPQHLLDPESAREQLGWLELRAKDSAIDLFIYVFEKDQELPGEVREEELIERFFMTGRPAMIVYYFLGQPEQAVLYLSPAVTDAISATEQGRALASAVMQAQAKATASQQLGAFITQLGTRLYRMERTLDHEPPATAATREAIPPAPARPPKRTKRPSAVAALFERWRPLVEPYARPAAAVAAALTVAFGLLLWWRRRATYLLPEFDVEPRLGGNHAAGIGGVISFASPSLPPTSQRSQAPPALRRP
jgi:hypothetical protein